MLEGEMTDQESEHFGRLDDEAEQQEPSSTHDGPAAAGEYDPSQGSPHNGVHPVFHQPPRPTFDAEDGS
jgi:hypothetical protein